MIVIYRSASAVEYDTDKAADGPLELERLGADDIDTRVRAIRQVVLLAIRIDEADIERLQRIAGDLNRSLACGLRR